MDKYDTLKFERLAKLTLKICESYHLVGRIASDGRLHTLDSWVNCTEPTCQIVKRELEALDITVNEKTIVN